MSSSAALLHCVFGFGPHLAQCTAATNYNFQHTLIVILKLAYLTTEHTWTLSHAHIIYVHTQNVNYSIGVTSKLCEFI